MSRQAKIIIFSLILLFSIYNYQTNENLIDRISDITENARKKNTESIKTENSNDSNNYSANRKVFRTNGGTDSQIFEVNENDLPNFFKKFPEAVDLSYAYRNKEATLWVNNSNSNNTPPTETFNKNNSETKKSPVGNVKKIGDYKYKTKLTNRNGTYSLYEDKKNIGKAIRKITLDEDPVVYVISEGAFTNEVILEFKDKSLYKGFLINTIIPPSAKQNQTNSNSNKQFDLDSDDYLKIPSTGSSPYNSYFGSGIFNDTENYVEVTAPEKTHVVFILINSRTNKRVRNVFIRKGETYKMNQIPYGTYDYMYFTGRNWSNELTINNGKVKGAFKDYPSFNKNKFKSDQMEFEEGYYGGYQIKLIQSIGGNLETQTTTESNFFN